MVENMRLFGIDTGQTASPGDNYSKPDGKVSRAPARVGVLPLPPIPAVPAVRPTVSA